jgi:hypothetical protein
MRPIGFFVEAIVNSATDSKHRSRLLTALLAILKFVIGFGLACLNSEGPNQYALTANVHLYSIYARPAGKRFRLMSLPGHPPSKVGTVIGAQIQP